MPVKIETFEPFSDEEFETGYVNRRRARPIRPWSRCWPRSRPEPVRVPLVQGQSARGLRTAISRAAGSRGINVETVAGDGFVAVKKLRSATSPQDPPRPGDRGAAPARSTTEAARGRRGRVAPSRIWPPARAKPVLTSDAIAHGGPWVAHVRKRRTTAGNVASVVSVHSRAKCFSSINPPRVSGVSTTTG